MPQALGAGIAALIGLGAVSAGTATAIGTIAINVGLAAVSTAASMLLGPRPPAVKPSSAQQEVRQPLAPRTKSYGRVRKSGVMFWGGTDSVSRKNLYLGYALNHGRIAGIDAFHIDDNEVEIDGTGQVTTSPYNDITTRLLYRLGLPTEAAYQDLSTVFGMSAVRGDGVTSLLGIFRNKADATNQMERYPAGLPQVRVTMRASVCFDPRNPAHDVNDPLTWEWSENLGVIIMNYLIDPEGYGMSYARILPNLAEWIEQINICDEDVAKADGSTEKRYRGAGTYDLTERPTDIMARMLAACDGRLWQRRDGSIGFSVGRFVTPTVTIESKDILSYRMERGQDTLTAVAGLRAQFMSPQHDYREHEAEPWPSGEAILGLDDDRINNLDLLWSPSHAQTRRLMKREFIRNRAEWKGQISTNLSGLRAMDERFIRVAIDELGIDETFEVGKFTLDPSTLRCQIELLSVGAEIDDWDAATEEGVSIPLTSLTVFASSISTTFGSGVAWPVGIQAGDVAVLFLGSGDLSPSAPIPVDGFELLSTAIGVGFGGLNIEGYAAFRVLDGTETGTLATDASLRAMLILRGDRPIKGVLHSIWSAEATAGDAVSQSIAASTATAPVVALGWLMQQNSPRAFSTETPTFATKLTGDFHVLGYTIYTSSPVNHTVDISDRGDYNFLTSGWLSFTT